MRGSRQLQRHNGAVAGAAAAALWYEPVCHRASILDQITHYGSINLIPLSSDGHQTGNHSLMNDIYQREMLWLLIIVYLIKLINIHLGWRAFSAQLLFPGRWLLSQQLMRLVIMVWQINVKPHVNDRSVSLYNQHNVLLPYNHSLPWHLWQRCMFDEFNLVSDTFSN